MMRNIFAEVEYEGTSYFGFQIQNKKDRREVTVQEVLEKALGRLFKEKIRIDYASRTDRGVHARAQAINFKVKTNIKTSQIKKALNSFLPSDIKIKVLKYLGCDFNARFKAQSNKYRYLIFRKKKPSVFWRNFTWHIDEPLDIEKMKKAAKALVGRRDFSLFARSAKDYKHCIRCVKDITFSQRDGLLYVDIEADAFLRNMARNIVSFLVKVGKGEFETGDVNAILEAKTSYVNKPAPAQGLYLYKVNYP
ncbi:MAG: tRNA pseudouridine(38-40) synthase TruA [Candidatus Omnitrophota bacterium]|nr:MAG: tRNA pseudouridine(38-40) synthase TruA [Candidatus Omnitrophota bacterium]